MAALRGQQPAPKAKRLERPSLPPKLPPAQVNNAVANDVLEILARTLGTVGDHADLYDNGGSWFADAVDDRGYGLAVAADRTVLVVSDEGFVRHRLRLVED